MKALNAAKQRSILVTLLSFILILTLFSAAGAQSSGGGPTGGSTVGSPVLNGGGGAVPGGPGYVAISAINFKPYNPSTPYTFVGSILNNTTSSTNMAYFEAPFVIPNGATITKMVVYFQDTASSADLIAYLVKGAYFASAGSVMASFFGSGTHVGLVYGETSDITTPLVDLSMNSYWVEVALPGNSLVSLNGVRIDYTFTSSLPAINKQ